jgi:hypothetical protein
VNNIKMFGAEFLTEVDIEMDIGEREHRHDD